MSVAATISPAVDRDAWLRERQTGIGASEAPAVLGWSPFAGPMEIYLRKIGEMPEQEQNEQMEIGLLMEPVIQSLYERRTGRKIRESQLFVRDIDRPYIFATVDAITEDDVTVEFKNMDGWKSSRELGEEGSDQVPEHWILQAHQQMFVTGSDCVDFAVLVGGNRFKSYRVDRQESIIDAMIPALEQFWARVQTRQPPEDIGPVNSRLLKVLYPDCDGEIDFDDEGADAVGRWELAKAEVKQSEEAKDAAKSEILARMGNSALARLPDGRVVTRKLVTVKPSVVTLDQVVEAGGEFVFRKGYEFADLRVKAPKGGNR